MSLQRKPTIVFCHGIWADGSCFSKVIPALQADGHEVIAVQYSLESFDEDVAMVKRTLNRVGTPFSSSGTPTAAPPLRPRASMIALPALSTSERSPRMLARLYRTNSTNIPRISFLASRSRTGSPGCLRTGLSFSAETFPSKSKSSSGPPIFHLSPTYSSNKRSRARRGSRSQIGTFCACKIIPFIPIFSAGFQSVWERLWLRWKAATFPCCLNLM